MYQNYDLEIHLRNKMLINVSFLSEKNEIQVFNFLRQLVI